MVSLRPPRSVFFLPSPAPAPRLSSSSSSTISSSTGPTTTHLLYDCPDPYLITRDRAAIAYAEAEHDIGRSGGYGLATVLLISWRMDLPEPVAALAASIYIVLLVVFLLFLGRGEPSSSVPVQIFW